MTISSKSSAAWDRILVGTFLGFVAGPARIRPGNQDYTVKLTALNAEAILGPADLVVECFDNAESRRVVQNHVRSQKKGCVHAGLAADGGFGVVRWDPHFVIDDEDAPDQATCEAGGFLPIIARVASCLVASIQFFLSNRQQVNWNISPRNAESF